MKNRYRIYLKDSTTSPWRTLGFCTREDDAIESARHYSKHQGYESEVLDTKRNRIVFTGTATGEE